MVEYVEPPKEWARTGLAVFFAGGITDCPDWQADARKLLPGVAVLNPRRKNFPINDPSAAREQIAWEFRHLHRATVVLFWFACGPSPQPIALYELGRHAALGRPIAVGTSPGYTRKADVWQQLAHARPDVPIHHTLSRTCVEAQRLLAEGGER